MPKSLSKTPAPKKDRIFGSDKNKVGSASSKASAKGIELSESILATLSQKAKDYNESHPNSKVSVATLKAVMRRGMGAYSTSHRPTITGGAPNSRQAWGFARVNKFLKKKAGQQVKAAYVQDDDLMADGGEVKEYKIDGKDATFEEFKKLYQRESGEFRTFDLNPKKVEYLGNNEQSLRYVNEYNYIISPFMKDGSLKDNYMKAKISETYDNVPFRTFASSFRKHIDPSFKASSKELKKGRTFKDIASYVISDGGYYIKEDMYRAFAKDFDIEIPTKDNYSDGGETKKSKEAYTIVGVYKSTNDLGREESEDLTKEGLLGYRIRYNKMPLQYYAYVGYENTESDLERAKSDVARYNKEVEDEKQRKKARDLENKIKREKQKIIDSQKLEVAKSDDTRKPAYLMTKSEYEDRVVPLLKEYEKFARKNDKYLSLTAYNGFYKVTFEQVLSRGLDGKTSGYYFRNNDEKELIENWNERKFRKYEDFTSPEPTPKEILEKNIAFFKDLNKFFDEKVIFDGLNSDYKKSNKTQIRRAIEDDTYKRMIENGEITEDEVIKIAEEQGIKVPKKVFSQESLLKKEAKKQMDEILSKIPKMNKDVFESLLKQLSEDFKDVEKIVIERETERIEGLIKEYIELSEKEGGVDLEKLKTAIPFWAHFFHKYEEIVIRGKDYRGYPNTERFLKNLKLQSDYKRSLDKIILDYADSLKYRFLKAVMDNFPRVTKPISNITRQSLKVGAKGFEGRYRFNFADGSYFDFVTEAIPAAGYNIVSFHYRYLTRLENATLADGKKIKGYYEIMQNFSSDSMSDGGSVGQEITCVNCGWHWNTSDSDESDKYICHKCGFDNRTFYDPEPIGDYENGGLIVSPTENLIESVRKEREKKIAEWYKLGSKIVVARNDGYSYKKESERDSEFIESKNPSQRKVLEIIKENPDLTEISFNGTIKVGDKVGEELEVVDDFSVVLWEKYSTFFKEGLKFEFVQDNGKYINTIVNKNDTITYKDRKDDGNYIYFNQLDKNYGTISESRSKKDILKEEFDNQEAVFIKDNYADGGLIAPNGKKSNLTPEQYKLVRTTEFKAWFGDWENDPENASKVVDKNGEPLVVFRGFNKVHDKGFVFKFNINRFKNNRKTNKFGHYFTISEKVAKEYAEQGEKQDEKDIIIKSYFLNIRHLLDITKANKRYPTFEEWSVVREKGFMYSKYDIIEKLKRREVPIHSYLFDESPLDVKDENDLDEVSEAKIKQLEKIIAKQDARMKEFYNASETISLPALIHIITGESREVIDEKLKELQENASLRDEAYVNADVYDWFIKYKSKDFRFMEDLDEYLKKLIIDNGYDGVKFIENMIGSVRGLTDSVYVTFDSNQIKLADGTNTTFDSKNPDIRYEYGGSLTIPSQHDLIKMELGLELFKPSKTIEQIAKEKDVPLDYAEEQLRKGMKTESEHSDNPIVQETIALQHLDEMIDYYEKLEYMESQNKMAKGDLLDNSLFNKALIYKSIKPIRQANEIIERLDYMEIQNKMAKGGVTEFYKQYQDWYKNGVSDKMTIMVSVPNAFSKMSSEDNHVILDVFEKRDESVDGKEKLKELLALADKNGIDVYLEPIPRHNKINDEAKKEKITREYLISYYEKFGFELLPNGFMVRKHKNNKMEKGGYYKAGGEINPDDKNVKDYFSHGSGNVGGVLVGKRHSEGGIKAVNKSTNQPLEMEGGEVVITRNAVSDNEKREFEGKMMTNREILSKINESGGGVSFADGGDIPESIYTSGKEYKYGGKMMKDHEIVSSCGCKNSMAEGGEVTSNLLKVGDKVKLRRLPIYYHSGYVGRQKESIKIIKKIVFVNEEDVDPIEWKGVSKITQILANTKDNLLIKFTFYDNDLIGAYSENARYEPVYEDGGYLAEGGETDYQTELKNHLFPKIEVEVEVEIEPVMEEMMVNEHYVTADDLGLSDGMPMLAVGTIVYSSGGNDQWEVVSFSDDGVNLVNKPKSPLQSKMEDKHLTFEELSKYFKDKSISIKNISTERELEPAIALVKNKLPQKSYAMGGFIDGDEDEDAKIMQSQFGKSNFK
jgi:hypothetical protein